jgi:squalene-associated FAD-dependent desaturase
VNPDVIVVGGGCAGLAAATALVEHGRRVLVLEARPILGGRASAVRDPVTGETLDNGQHVLMGCYDDTLSFLHRIGTADRVRRQTGLTVGMIDRSGRVSTLALPPLPAPLHLLAGVLAWDALSWSEKLSVLKVGAFIARGAGTDDRRSSGAGVTVRNWLLRRGQVPRLIELFWEPLALAALNQPIDEAAVDTFLEVLGRMFGPEADRASLIVPAVPLDELYAEPARQWLEARGSAVRSTAPARIVVDGDRLVGVDVRGERLEARTVICAAPWYALGDVFPGHPAALADLLDRAAATAGSPIVTVNLWYERTVMDGMLVGLPGRVFQWVFDKGQVFGRDRSHLSLVSSGASDVVRKTNADLIAIGRRNVEEAIPGARAARLLHASAVRERQATFSLAPGQPSRPGTRTPVRGLFLAGDWVDTGLPATIESGVVSGHWAAAAATAGS